MKKILTLLLLASVGQIQAQDKTIEKNFSNIKSIQLSTSSGDVTIRKARGTSVEVAITHSYSSDVFTPVMEESNGKLTLKEEFVRGSHSGNASWTVAIPDNIRLNMNSGSGDITITDVKADMKSSLGSGDITIEGVSGELTFNTGSGDIRLEDTEGELSFNTGSGDIRSNGGRGSFRFNAGSGNIELLNVNGTFEINTGSGDIESGNLQLNGPGKFNSGSGDAVVSLSGNLDHSISIASGSGDAKLRFNGAPIEGEVTMTANERNGDIVAPFKFDKEETIEDGNSSPRIRKTTKLGNKDIQIKVSTGSGTAEIAK